MTPVIDMNVYRDQKALVLLSLTSPARPDVYRFRGDDPRPKPHPDGPVIRPFPDRPAAA